MNEGKTYGVSYERGCNSRAFRFGYQDAANGVPSREDEHSHRWRLMYITGRQTVAYARGEGNTVHEVSPTKKLPPEIKEAIAIQAAQMIAATSDDHITRLSALFFLGEKGVAT